MLAGTLCGRIIIAVALLLYGVGCNAAVLAITAEDVFARPGETLRLSVEQSGLETAASGFQAFLTYSDAHLAVDASNITLTDVPYGFPVLKEVVSPDINLSASIDVFSGQEPTTQDAVLAEMTFTALPGDGTYSVAFRPNNPPSRFSDAGGDPIAATLIDSPDLIIDGTAPTITHCPENIVVPNDPGEWSAQVDPGEPTADDALSGVDTIVGVRSDALSLTDPYPVGLTTIRWSVTDRCGNVARCVQQVVVYAVGILEPRTADRFVKPGEPIYVTLDQYDLLVPVTGYQAFLSFDSLMISISASDISFTSAPYGLPILKQVNGESIDLAAGVNTFIGQEPSWDDATLANMQFTAGATEGVTSVVFRPHEPPSLFTDSDGNPVYPALKDSVELVIDGTPPSITCPGDILTAAPDGFWSATVNVGSPTATDGLSGIKSIVGQRSDGLALADPYPVGGTTITWTATDKSENQSTCRQLVVVGPPGFTGQLVKTVAEAKQLPDGTGIALLSPIVTRSLADADCYYVEDFDRTAGIRVDHIYGDWPAESEEPAVFGTIQTIAGERVVFDSTSAPFDDGVVPDSLCMVARECCWPLAQGLFATICGRAAVDPGAVDEFLLCDGSHNPLYVQLHAGASCPVDGEFVRVTGVLGAQGTQALLHVNVDGDVLLVPE